MKLNKLVILTALSILILTISVFFYIKNQIAIETNKQNLALKICEKETIEKIRAKVSTTFERSQQTGENKYQTNDLGAFLQLANTKNEFKIEHIKCLKKQGLDDTTSTILTNAKFK